MVFIGKTKTKPNCLEDFGGVTGELDAGTLQERVLRKTAESQCWNSTEKNGCSNFSSGGFQSCGQEVFLESICGTLALDHARRNRA